MSLLVATPALAQTSSRGEYVRSLDRMMVALARESARDSKQIKSAYKAHLDLLVLDHYGSLEEALWNGGVARLPGDPRRFNVAPRIDGPLPIGEKDLERQGSYIAARPATIGALVELASRVRSGPVEITSMVRHSEYQGALRASNANATTSVPMHTMGLAFDVALVNTPLKTVYEIRDVLQKMRREGKILFIGERRQLVFHVVPAPSRLGYFTDVYARAVGPAASLSGTHVVAFAAPAGRRFTGNVTAEVIAIVPPSELAEAWWAADHANADVIIRVSAPPAPASGHLEATAPAPTPVVAPLGALLLASVTFAAWLAGPGQRGTLHSTGILIGR